MVIPLADERKKSRMALSALHFFTIIDFKADYLFKHKTRHSKFCDISISELSRECSDCDQRYLPIALRPD